jgi:rhodanese-related sulfurtransferase
MNTTAWMQEVESRLEQRSRAMQEQFAEQLFLLDVREPNEFEYARIENGVLIPLNQIPQRLGS